MPADPDRPVLEPLFWISPTAVRAAHAAAQPRRPRAGSFSFRLAWISFCAWMRARKSRVDANR